MVCGEFGVGYDLAYNVGDIFTRIKTLSAIIVSTALSKFLDSLTQF
jgi:hypothetical protein